MDPYLYLFDGAKIMLLIELSKSISNYLHTQGFAGAPKFRLTNPIYVFRYLTFLST